MKLPTAVLFFQYKDLNLIFDLKYSIYISLLIDFPVALFQGPVEIISESVQDIFGALSIPKGW